MIIVMSSSSKGSIFKMFLQAAVFKCLRFEECFWKPPFSWRIRVDSRPNRRNKTAFSNFSGVVWTRPNVNGFFVSINLHGYWPRESKRSIKHSYIILLQNRCLFLTNPLELHWNLPSGEKGKILTRLLAKWRKVCALCCCCCFFSFSVIFVPPHKWSKDVNRSDVFPQIAFESYHTH